MTAEERDVRALAVEVLVLVNQGGHPAERVSAAKERLEEAARELRREPRPAAVAAG